MAAAEDFRVSARTGFLGEGGTDKVARVRFKTVLSDVIKQIKAEPEELPTAKDAKIALRVVDPKNKILPGAVIEMILGSEIVHVDLQTLITLIRKKQRKAKKVSDHDAEFMKEIAADIKAQKDKGVQVPSRRSIFETMSAVAQCQMAGVIIERDAKRKKEAVVAEMQQADVKLRGGKKSYTKCWLCGGLILSKSEADREPASPECEHILPAISAVMFRGMFTQGARVGVGGGNVVKGFANGNFATMTANNYLWAHNICNANAKSAKFLINYTKGGGWHASKSKCEDLAKDIAQRVGQRNPWCLYGGTREYSKTTVGKGWGRRLKNLWSGGLKVSATSLPANVAKLVREILMYQWDGSLVYAMASCDGLDVGGDFTAMQGGHIPVTCYTAYNGSAFWYKDKGKYVIDIMLPKNRIAGAKKKITELQGLGVVARSYVIKYGGEIVKGSTYGQSNFGWKACYDVLKIEYDYHAARIQAEFEEVQKLVKSDPALSRVQDASFRAFAAYCLEIGRLYFLSEKGKAIGLTRKEMRYRGGGRRRRQRAGFVDGALPKDNEELVGAAEEAAEKLKAADAAAAAKAAQTCFPIIFATQLYYTQAWSDIDYNILDITNVKAQGGGAHIQKGGNKTISQARIMNFFTYLLLGNNIEKKEAVMNVVTDSDALASLWMPIQNLGGAGVELPESLVAVTCQIMSWIFIARKYGLEYLKKYDPAKKNSPIGRRKDDVKAAAVAAMNAQQSDATYSSTLSSGRGYTGDKRCAAFINAICCLLNAAFRFIEAMQVPATKRRHMRSYQKDLDDAATAALAKKPDGTTTKIGKSQCYRAVLKKILDTFTLTNMGAGVNDCPPAAQQGPVGDRHSPRLDATWKNIQQCIVKYYKHGDWSNLGKVVKCKPITSFGGGHKRTKKKRRRRHTRHRRRRHRRRKTRHRKQRRRRRRRTRR